MNIREKIIVFALSAFPALVVFSPKSSVVVLVTISILFLPDILTIQTLKTFTHTPFSKIIVAFLVLGSFSVLWGLEPFEIIKRIIKITSITLMFVCVTLYIEKKGIPEKTIMGFSYTVIFGLIVFLAIRIGGDEALELLSSLKGKDLEWSAFNSSFVLYGIFIWIAFINILKKHGSMAYLILVFFAGLNFFYDSNATKLSLLAGILVHFIYIKQSLWKFFRAGFVIGITAIALAPAIITYSLPIERGGKWMPDHKSNPVRFIGYSNIVRLLIWDFTISKIEEKPILGWGLDAARRIPGGNDTVEDGKIANMYLHPHNAFLQIWLELGITGAVLFLFLLVFISYAQKQNWQNTIWRKYMPPVIVSVVIPLSVSYGVWQSWWLALFVLVYLYCTITSEQKYEIHTNYKQP